MFWKMTSRFFTLCVFLLGILFSSINGQSCSREEHQKCVSLADPLLKDPHLIFPDNIQDIDMVCRTWSNFVDCIRRYIENCFSDQRKEQFNMAVEAPIASVHQMCSVSTYQTEYLQYASCIKATVTEVEHCGNQYASLVDEVSRREVSRTSLCCSHYYFRSCVISEARKRCDGSQAGGAAARFSRQVLDRALSFLQDQCQNYIPNNSDCPISTTENFLSISVSPLELGSDGILGTRNRPYHRTVSTDLYSGQASDIYDSNSQSQTTYSTVFRSTGRALNLFPTKEPERTDAWSSPARVSTESTNRDSINSNENAISSKVGGDMKNEVLPQIEPTSTNIMQNDERPAVIVTQRPATYGRGMSWSSPATESASEVPAWATGTWLASNQVPMTDESWYPEAGNFGENHIDGPNQQGLSKNGQAYMKNRLILTVIMSVAFYVL